MTMKDEPPKSESVQYATGEEWKTSLMRLGQSRKNIQLWMCLLVKVKSEAINKMNLELPLLENYL